MKAVLLLLFLISLNASGAPRPQQDSSPSNVLHLAVEVDPHSLDPAQIFSNEEGMIGRFLFQTLLDLDSDGQLVPSLASELPTTSRDGLTHTFRLRPGLRFANGDDLTADDVVYTFERYFDPKNAALTVAYFRSIRGATEFEMARKQEAADPTNRPPGAPERWIEPRTVSGLRALDRRTVQIELTVPDLSFLQILTSPPAAIVPRAEVERSGAAFATRPVGSGRFRLTEWIRGVRIRLERNPHVLPTPPSTPDSVLIAIGLDQSTQVMMFERGELDFAQSIHDADFPRVTRPGRLKDSLRSAIGSTPTYVFLNCELPPFTNHRVRRALNHAIDRDHVVRVFANRSVAAVGPLPLAVRGYNQGLPAYDHDPAKARVLLSEAGLPQGFETTLWVARDHPTWVKLAEIVQQDLGKIGVRVELKFVSFPAMLEASGRRRSVPMGVWDWSFPAMLEASGRRRSVPMGVWDWLTPFDDPKETLDTLLNGEKIVDESCLNNAFYSNRDVERWFREADATADAQRRAGLFHKIERQIVDDAPWIFLVQFNTDTLVQPWVRGYSPRGFWPPVRFDYCWIER